MVAAQEDTSYGPSQYAYRPISDYGIIGDCRTAALVSNQGSIDWLCLPNFDGPAIFSRLLDARQGGHFSIHPEGPFRFEQSYLEGTNVLVTTFTTPSGSTRLIDFMMVPWGQYQRRVILPLRQLVRRVECTAGAVDMEVEYQPRPYFSEGYHPVEMKSHHHIGLGHRGWYIHLLSQAPLEPDQPGARGRFRLAQWEAITLVLGYDEHTPAAFPVAEHFTTKPLEETVTFWRQWLSRCTYDGPYREAVLRSALLLKLLAFAPSGAIVAAPTTSLPEKVGGVRNWDYRYCWLRDASLTLQALQNIGFSDEAEAFLDWMLHSTRITQPRLKVVYNVFGEPRLSQRDLYHLEGYRGSKPVRVGNQASEQYQLDVYGEVLDGVFKVGPDRPRLSSDARRLVEGAANFVARHWHEPDHGIWEMQEKRHFVHSKALCWVALHRAYQLLGEDQVSRQTQRWWQSVRDQIARVVDQEGYNQELGAFVQVLGSQELDASLLTLPILGFIEPGDPRMVSTVQAIQQRLTARGHVYRYLTDDGLPPGEGAFTACTFWLAHSLALQGDVQEAKSTFQAVSQCANHLGLLSEEIDPDTGELLGNFPQGLSHIGLINAAVAIQQAEARGVGRRRRE